MKLGTSLTAVTTRLAVSVAVLNAVVPPLGFGSAVSPFRRSSVPGPERQGDPIVPLKFDADEPHPRVGVRRQQPRRVAVTTPGDPCAAVVQEYSQTPLAVSAAVIARPSTPRRPRR